MASTSHADYCRHIKRRWLIIEEERISGKSKVVVYRLPAVTTADIAQRRTKAVTNKHFKIFGDAISAAIRLSHLGRNISIGTVCSN
ncbi:hypothetical protein OH492_21455 [Vibrio chagasii]|nr:hypothetical protein [Vibrio chagasii]